MRAGYAFLLAALLGACGSDQTGDDDGGDGTMMPDAGGIAPPARGFQLQSPEIDIQAGQEITYCWYFRTPNTASMAIGRWKSSMTPGSHHMIMFTSNSDIKPVGTVSAADCGTLGGGVGNFPVWTYAAQMPEADLQLPLDDGAGKPLAIDIAANQAGFFQMHYLNAGDTPIKVRVTLNAEALAEGATYTKTAAYVTFNGNISIPPMTNNHTQSMSCNVPATSKFWLMSTHAHKQAVHTAVKDSTSMVFESADWEHPGARAWEKATPFYQFTSGKLTYECTWNNPTTRTIQDGDSAQYDEMCMASGYFFPATRPVFCYNNITL
jgi:hypothetical protein